MKLGDVSIGKVVTSVLDASPRSVSKGMKEHHTSAKAKRATKAEARRTRRVEEQAKAAFVTQALQQARAFAEANLPTVVAEYSKTVEPTAETVPEATVEAPPVVEPEPAKRTKAAPTKS